MGFRFDSALSASNPPSFQPCQIVCLESQNTYLYAEVVQLVESRKVCWVHPLVLVCGSSDPQDDRYGPGMSLEGRSLEMASCFLEGCFDLRNCSDLLLPWGLFRAAIDTEVMPLLSFLYQPEACASAPLNGVDVDRASHQMHQFIHQLCKARPEAF